MNKEDFLQRDRLLKAISENGHYRIIVVKTTNIVRTARENHNLSLLSTILLGRTLTAALLLASNLKGEERIQVRLEGNGPIGAVNSEATSHGEVRGYVSHPEAALNLDNGEKLGDGIGVGVMTVSKVLYNKARPVTGTVALARGNVNEDLAHYLLQSEQVPSAVSLDVALDEQGNVSQAGGVMVQAMPGAEKEETELIEKNIRNMPQVGEQLQAAYLDDVLEAVSRGMTVRELDRYPVDFFCRCSRDRFKKSLAMVNPDDLLKMDASTEELVCHYCGERYEFSKEEIESIAQKAKVRQN